MKKYKGILLTIVFILLINPTTLSHGDVTEQWTNTYGGAGYDNGYSVVQTSDGGYAIAGTTNSFGAGSNDVYLVKTDSSGNVEWDQTYGVAGDQFGYYVVQTSDGGYAIVGALWAPGYDMYLVKTDSSGNMEWDQTYGGAGSEWAYSVVQTSDGGYAIAGYTYSFGAGGSDMYLVKTDSSGNMEWDQTYGGIWDDLGLSVVKTSGGGYAIAGRTDSFGAGGSDMYLVKTDSSGNMDWDQTYGGTGGEAGLSVVKTGDGGYAIAGTTDSFGAGMLDMYLVKTDSSGNMEWDQTYGGTDDEEGYSVVQTSGGRYAIAGYTYSFGAGGSDVYLVKTDSSGNMDWDQTYGGTDDEYGWSIIKTGDGGYAIAGTTDSFGAGRLDIYLIKLKDTEEEIEEATTGAISPGLILATSGEAFYNPEYKVILGLHGKFQSKPKISLVTVNGLDQTTFNISLAVSKRCEWAILCLSKDLFSEGVNAITVKVDDRVYTIRYDRQQTGERTRFIFIEKQ